MSRIYNLILTILAIPIVIIIRLLSPFVLIRLGGIDISRIGNFSHLDWYKGTRHLNICEKNSMDMFYFYSSFGNISNVQLSLMWRRVLRVLPFGQYIYAIDKLNSKISGYHLHSIKFPYKKNNPHIKKNNTRKINQWTKALLDCKTPFIKFTLDEEMRGERILQKLGVPKGNDFISFHARDPAYLKTIDRHYDWSYHDFRDSSIQNYILAAEEMVQRSYFCLRVGNRVDEKIISSNPSIIDYAFSSEITDYMDIFLFAKNRFMICSDTGISEAALLFRRPLVRVNWVPICRHAIWAHNEVRIFKKFFLKKENRILTFNEINELGIADVGVGTVFDKLDIELIENTPEEIMAATIEMDERLKSSWVSSKEDEELQDCFWSRYGHGPGILKSPEQRIGADYLRDNKFLLD